MELGRGLIWIDHFDYSLLPLGKRSTYGKKKLHNVNRGLGGPGVVSYSPRPSFCIYPVEKEDFYPI